MRGDIPWSGPKKGEVKVIPSRTCLHALGSGVGAVSVHGALR